MARTATTMRRFGVTTLMLVTLAGCSGGAGEPAPATAPTVTAEPVAITPVAGPAPAGPALRTSVPDSGPLPAGLLLPDEGVPSTDPDFTDWITDSSPGQEWLLDPCVPTAYPTDAARVRFRTVSQRGPEALAARQLAVYPSAEIAAEVLTGFRRAIAACSTGTTELGDRWSWVSADAPGLGDDALIAASTVGPYPGWGVGNRIAVTRVGSAVFLAYGGGEFFTAELDQSAEDMRAVAERFLDSL